MGGSEPDLLAEITLAVVQRDVLALALDFNGSVLARFPGWAFVAQDVDNARFFHQSGHGLQQAVSGEESAAGLLGEGHEPLVQLLAKVAIGVFDDFGKSLVAKVFGVSVQFVIEQVEGMEHDAVAHAGMDHFLEVGLVVG